jgi:hypothetical protein
MLDGALPASMARTIGSESLREVLWLSAATSTVTRRVEILDQQVACQRYRVVSEWVPVRQYEADGQRFESLSGRSCVG